MIRELHISNYALIDRIDISFVPTLNIITGETGAGKSIILGALGLLRGNRADMRVRRDTKCKSVVEAQFDVKGNDRLTKLLSDNDIDSLGDTCILRRELTVSGGSRAFVNDTPVTVAVMAQIADTLFDIHSQHENRLLTDHGYQIDLLDALGGNHELRRRYSMLYKAYRDSLAKYTHTRDMVLRNRAETEYITYQLQQLDELDIKAGEQAELERQRDIAANMARIRSALTSAIDSIDGETPVTHALSSAADQLRDISGYYADADDMADRLLSAKLEIQDVLETLTGYAAGMSSDVPDLESIEERLGAIYSLESRHHVDSDRQLIALRDRMRRQLQTINNADDILAQLEQEAKRAKKEAVLAGRELSQRRQDTAQMLAAEIVRHASPLGLPNIKCRFDITRGKLTASGIDQVEFMLAFNRNQPLMPVGKTASGGEISRLVLAIKSIAVKSMNMPTIVFDEVDTGVSGDIANRIARLMHDLARDEQVIVITHLPQVAAAGDCHFKVSKHDVDDATVTGISMLDHGGRLAELALMLSGSQTQPEALAAARSLMDNFQLNINTQQTP